MSPAQPELAGRALAGKGAVVTGGGRGIGAAVARELAAAGAAVVVAARSAEELAEVVAELTASGARAAAIPCDVTDPEQVAELSRRAIAAIGQVDILVNNAGIAGSAPLRSIRLEDWNRMLAVNATGTFLVTQQFLPAMLERRWGRVVNVASIAGRAGAAYIAAYGSSKHAVVGFTRCVAAEAAPHGVTVNAVCPGYVDTAMTAESVGRIVAKTGMPQEHARERIVNMNPQGRLLTAGEVAFAVRFLCEPAAAGINGEAIVLDGGALLA